MPYREWFFGCILIVLAPLAISHKVYEADGEINSKPEVNFF